MFYERISNLCKERNEKLTPLLKSLGISTGNISNWKNGLENISAENLKKIADYFNVSIDYLLCRTDNPSYIEPIEYTYSGIEKIAKEAGFTNEHANALNETDKELARIFLRTLTEKKPKQ